MGGNPFARYLFLQMLLHTLSIVVPLAQGLGERPAQTGFERRKEGAWPRPALRAYLIGRRPGRGCCTLERQGMGYGTQPPDWKLDELESMKPLCLIVSVRILRCST
jgi:hypothetical protein